MPGPRDHAGGETAAVGPGRRRRKEQTGAVRWRGYFAETTAVIVAAPELFKATNSAPVWKSMAKSPDDVWLFWLAYQLTPSCDSITVMVVLALVWPKALPQLQLKIRTPGDCSFAPTDAAFQTIEERGET